MTIGYGIIRTDHQPGVQKNTAHVWRGSGRNWLSSIWWLMMLMNREAIVADCWDVGEMVDFVDGFETWNCGGFHGGYLQIIQARSFSYWNWTMVTWGSLKTFKKTPDTWDRSIPLFMGIKGREHGHSPMDPVRCRRIHPWWSRSCDPRGSS